MAATTVQNLQDVTGGKSGQSAPQADYYTQTYYGKTNGSGVADSQGEKEKKSEEQRKGNYDDVVNRYYDQVTDFYEYGWGQSFHFAPIRPGEAFSESQARHQHRLAVKVKAGCGMKILDVGCGVGGPAREIAELSGTSIVGLNINKYQVDRATRVTKEKGLDSLVSYVEGDFHHMPFEDNSFDGVYACEALCHSPDLAQVYSEVMRVMKPGSYFACYDWIFTDKYDSTSKVQYDVIHNLLEGNGLPCLRTETDIRETIKASGLDLLEIVDLSRGNPIPWFSPLTFGKDIAKSVFRATSIGRKTTQAMLIGMEKIGRAPKGVSKTHAMLCRGADGLVEAGKLDIFSPMLFFLARKPE
ncbi:uncharacterized protein LOC135829505 [Sycon ciliatum]|uniref:uncharacterized protein LOC135829505 n=1 Tax=Sycon ciliatum TaxID=27933 RepID=UPI0020AC823E|eukprot:scpid57123/ scgid35763/ Cycloartenol-C-24-methyltransferase 1; 24-sterol C-methyltransferase 1